MAHIGLSRYNTTMRRSRFPFRLLAIGLLIWWLLETLYVLYNTRL